MLENNKIYCILNIGSLLKGLQIKYNFLEYRKKKKISDNKEAKLADACSSFSSHSKNL